MLETLVISQRQTSLKLPLVCMRDVKLQLEHNKYRTNNTCVKQAFILALGIKRLTLRLLYGNKMVYRSNSIKKLLIARLI